MHSLKSLKLLSINTYYSNDVPYAIGIVCKLHRFATCLDCYARQFAMFLERYQIYLCLNFSDVKKLCQAD